MKTLAHPVRGHRSRYAVWGLTLAAAVAWSPPPAGLRAQQESEPPAGKTQDPVEDMRQTFVEAGLDVDLEAKTIAVPCVVNRPDQALEFLLIHRRGKAHEAMLVCDVKASVLNAAFLALGYEPGENARVVEKDPLPSREEVEAGAAWFDVFHPEGMKVWFTLRWEEVNDDGETVRVELPVEDVLIDGTTGEPVEEVDWIYLGGQMAPIYRGEPPVFVGDYEGNLVSTVYKPQPNHLVTMRHERANNDEIWWPGDRLPPFDTEVTLRIHRRKTALHEAREQRLAAERAAGSDDDGESEQDDDG